MELDELKHIWQQTQASAINQEVINNEQVMEMTRQKSKDVISKIKRNIILELIFTILFLGVLMILFWRGENKIAERITYFFIFLFVLSLAVYWQGIKALLNLQATHYTIKQSLERGVHELSHFVKLYFIMNIIFAPIATFLGFYLGGYQWLKSPFIPIIVTIILLIPLYWWTKKYIKKLYGNHLEKLKYLLSELENLEP
ncbi:MAG: hypothetical protein MUF58_04705 [Arcicella sp.]|jgi:hypothetical protein|nr:hypothetical protein [Arcicella sp.]